jgi:hypothetical protein
MDIDVKIDKESLNINIDNPYRFDISRVTKNIIDFGKKTGVDLSQLKIDKLILKMIRGVAGCEEGCPADAKSLVREGFENFAISYVEGGILTAVHTLENGKPLEVKVFPEFN